MAEHRSTVRYEAPRIESRSSITNPLIGTGSPAPV
jgi:hypothetical protein